mgnify:CR=1 FL=1|jgi:phage-related baseplate assembly protein|nr:MAG TPA: baseplate assembly protein V [Caudoviricetes sp.]
MNREQERRLDNVLRFGRILEVDYQNTTARVQSGNIQTDFLPWITPRAGDVRIWSPPKVGEQVLVLAVSGEFNTGVILPSLFASNAPNDSPDEFSIHFPDDVVLKYNFASGHFSLTGFKTSDIQASGEINITCPTMNINGNLNIKGSVTSTGDMVAGGISQINHKHGNVQSGVSKTGKPE